MKVGEILRRAWVDLRRGENLDLIVTVSVAVILVLLDLLPFVEIPDGTVRALTLAVLALVGAALLANRYLIETIKEPKRLLKHRKDFPRLELVITEAKRAIWANGVSLDSLVAATEALKGRLREGCELRLMAVRPSEGAMTEVSRYYGGQWSDWAGKIRANLNTLHRELVQMAPDLAKLRTIDHRPGLGYFIIDPDRDAGRVTVATYLCMIPGTDIRPMLDLAGRTHSYWCEIYCQDFERLWESGEDWEPSE